MRGVKAKQLRTFARKHPAKQMVRNSAGMLGYPVMSYRAVYKALKRAWKDAIQVQNAK